MKILHILSSSKFSGAENVVCQIISMFRSDNNSSEYSMVYCSPDGPIRDALSKRNIEFEPIQQLIVKEIKQVIDRVKPDIIHTHDMRASWIGSLAAGKIPIIAHIHNNGFDSRKLNLKTTAFLLASRKIDHVFWVSKSAEQSYFFRRLIQKKSSVLPNIIDIEELKQKASTDSHNASSIKANITYLGRLQYPKNPVRFVEIISLVKKAIPDIKAVIIGDGDEFDLTKKRIQELNLEDNITMTGFIENPTTILKRTKALVMTSFWEGTPISSLEALTLGVPVVSTPVDGLKDIIINDYNGYLSDSNEELSQILVKLVTEKAYFERMSANAAETSEKINNKTEYISTIKHFYSHANSIL